LVTTISGSQYVVDLTERTSLRLPGAVSAVGADTPDAALLRKDAAAVELLEVIQCTVGQDLTLLLGAVDNYDGYIATTRWATAVVSIDPVL
jgi:hypothetical protein